MHHREDGKDNEDVNDKNNDDKDICVTKDDNSGGAPLPPGPLVFVIADDGDGVRSPPPFSPIAAAAAPLLPLDGATRSTATAAAVEAPIRARGRGVWVGVGVRVGVDGILSR